MDGRGSVVGHDHTVEHLGGGENGVPGSVGVLLTGPGHKAGSHARVSAIRGVCQRESLVTIIALSLFAGNIQDSLRAQRPLCGVP